MKRIIRLGHGITFVPSLREVPAIYVLILVASSGELRSTCMHHAREAWEILIASFPLLALIQPGLSYPLSHVCKTSFRKDGGYNTETRSTAFP